MYAGVKVNVAVYVRARMRISNLVAYITYMPSKGGYVLCMRAEVNVACA